MDGWNAGSSGVRSLIGDAASFAAVGIAARKAWKGTMDAINLSAMQKVQETTFQALLNSKAAGSALYDYCLLYTSFGIYTGGDVLAEYRKTGSEYRQAAYSADRVVVGVN